MAVRILAESSGIRLAKAGKTAGLQRSKTLDILFPGMGNLERLGERLNGIQEVVGSIPIGSTIILNGLRLIDHSEDSQL